MNPYAKMGIIVVLMVAVGAVVVLKRGGAPCCSPSTASQPEMAPPSAASATEGTARQYEPSTLPRLVDLGADKCIPCKMMAPILEQLKAEYQGKLEVVFLDVWKNPDAEKPYSINLIPTQIFIAPTGAELFRHEGFFSKEDILAKWKEFGYDFLAEAGDSAATTDGLQ
jgi:thioredoxin 1